jgi:hypothetical protein
MSTHYSLSGLIKIKPELCEEALAAATTIIEDTYSDYADISYNDAARSCMHVEVSGLFNYNTAEDWDDEITSFASHFAAEATALDRAIDGVDGALYVGPEGFDPLQAEITHVESQIERLRVLHVELRKRQCSGKP